MKKRQTGRKQAAGILLHTRPSLENSLENLIITTTGPLIKNCYADKESEETVRQSVTRRFFTTTRKELLRARRVDQTLQAKENDDIVVNDSIPDEMESRGMSQYVPERHCLSDLPPLAMNEDALVGEDKPETLEEAIQLLTGESNRQFCYNLKKEKETTLLDPENYYWKSAEGRSRSPSIVFEEIEGKDTIDESLPAVPQILLTMEHADSADAQKIPSSSSLDYKGLERENCDYSSNKEKSTKFNVNDGSPTIRFPNLNHDKAYFDRVSRIQQNPVLDLEKEEQSLYEQLDIVGDSATIRYPWQKDVAIQYEAPSDDATSANELLCANCRNSLHFPTMQERQIQAVKPQSMALMYYSSRLSQEDSLEIAGSRSSLESEDDRGSWVPNEDREGEGINELLISHENNDYRYVESTASSGSSPSLAWKQEVNNMGSNLMPEEEYSDDSQTEKNDIKRVEFITNTTGPTTFPINEENVVFDSEKKKCLEKTQRPNSEDMSTGGSNRLQRRRTAITNLIPKSEEISEDSSSEKKGALVNSQRYKVRRSGILPAVSLPSLIQNGNCSKNLEGHDSENDANASILANLSAARLLSMQQSYNSDIRDDSEIKKTTKWGILRRVVRDKDRLPITTALQNLRLIDYEELEFEKYKEAHWTDFLADLQKKDNELTTSLNLNEMEAKRREAVWELFNSECTYLIDHLLVLKNVFLKPLKAVQCEGYLMNLEEPRQLFSNLEELCEVTEAFCQVMFYLLKERVKRSPGEFGSTKMVVDAFTMFNTRVCPAYHTYCMNYSSSLGNLEHFKRNPDFLVFIKWCESDPRCNRLQLSDLIVAPLQHVTKYPLLLKNIRKRTEELTDRDSLSSIISMVENSISELEGKVKWIANLERLRELQTLIRWPTPEDISFVPEFLKPHLSKMQSNSNQFLANQKRLLIQEGSLTMLVDGAKMVEMYLFLFDDMLLVTKPRKAQRKKSLATDISILNAGSQKKENLLFLVHKQPIPLDRMEMIEFTEITAQGSRNSFALIHTNRYQQIQSLYTFQTSNEKSKDFWLTLLKETKETYMESVNKEFQFKDSSPSIKRSEPGTLQQVGQKHRKKTL